MTTSARNTILIEWNGLGLDEAAELILPCNGSAVWATLLAYNRPFDSPETLLATADKIWDSLPEEDWQQAFDSHPRLGESAAKAATAQSLRWSAGEQSGANPDEDERAELVEMNREYEVKFGRVFLLCATGRSTREMLENLRERMKNDPATELREAVEQQRLITRLRLRKWLGLAPLTCAELVALEGSTEAQMGLSTHILDTAVGRPAANVSLVLSQFRDNAARGAWDEIGHGCTDADGRCRTLLGERELEVATYKIRFDVGEYFAAQRVASLYPYVEIVFAVDDASQHYHVPLLISANGYTTYRGS